MLHVASAAAFVSIDIVGAGFDCLVSMIADMMEWKIPPIVMIACLLLSFNTAMDQGQDCNCRGVNYAAHV